MIDNIKQAISNLTAERDKIDDERVTTMAVLRNCRYLDFAHIDVIDRRYNDKIADRDQQIADMQAHLHELEAGNA